MEGSKYRITALIAFSLVYLSFMATAMAHEVDGILEKIHSRYGAHGGLIIHYRREVKTKTMSMLGNQVKGDIASGKMYILPPGLMRVEQIEPRREELITDGNSLWWVIPEEKKVYQYSSEQFGQELHHIGDIWDAPSRLKNRFNIRLLHHKDPRRLILEMLPSLPSKNVSRIRVELSKDLELKVLDIVNPIGTTTRFYFDAIEPANFLTRESFRFKVPDGFTVIHKVNQ